MFPLALTSGNNVSFPSAGAKAKRFPEVTAASVLGKTRVSEKCVLGPPNCRVQLQAPSRRVLSSILWQKVGEEARGETSPFLSRLTARLIAKWLCGLWMTNKGTIRIFLMSLLVALLTFEYLSLPLKTPKLFQEIVYCLCSPCRRKGCGLTVTRDWVLCHLCETLPGCPLGAAEDCRADLKI